MRVPLRRELDSISIERQSHVLNLTHLEHGFGNVVNPLHVARLCKGTFVASFFS